MAALAHRVMIGLLITLAGEGAPAPAWTPTDEMVQSVGKQQDGAGTISEHAQIDRPVQLDVTLPVIRADHKPSTLNLAQQASGKNLVLFFFSEQCGVTFRYKQRLRQIQQEYEPKRFTFIGIRCGQREKPDEPLDLAEARYLTMPFLDDASGTMMKTFRVQQSLTFALIDKEGRLRYRGGFDNSVDEKRVTKHYLRNALRALAAGNRVPAKEGPAIGCAILPIK